MTDEVALVTLAASHSSGVLEPLVRRGADLSLASRDNRSCGAADRDLIAGRGLSPFVLMIKGEPCKHTDTTDTSLLPIVAGKQCNKEIKISRFNL